MEIAILGLAGAGKSSFVNAITSGNFESNVMPTVGFQMSKVQKGKVTIKVWDMGGQKKFRGMWERYCRGVEVIVFVVDANEQKSFQLAKKELKALLAKPTLNGIPLLTLLNKNDLRTAAQPELIVKDLDLESIKDREVFYFSVSCKSMNNIDRTLEWIIAHTKNKKGGTATPAAAAATTAAAAAAPAPTDGKAAKPAAAAATGTGPAPATSMAMGPIAKPPDPSAPVPQTQPAALAPATATATATNSNTAQTSAKPKS